MSESLVRPMKPLLLLDGHCVPSLQVVQVLLHDHVAAAGERGVLLADDGGVDGCLVDGVLRAVDEAHQVAVVEILEAVHLVGRRRRRRRAAP